ncbi:hypothetical protein FS842_010351 [Serendipita sp. 407]|nr:hypothetical protein FS842_010351 [Serendipita sp. 407]
MPLSAVSPTTVHHFEIDSPIDSTSPTNLTHEEMLSDLSSALAKKKKKKKPKKAKTLSPISVSPTAVTEVKQQVLCISRNKHWRYISSYHGPWLQLPLELLESLLTLNMDPTNFMQKDERMPPRPNGRRAISPPPQALVVRQPSPKPVPPPIDPGVFRSVATIRRLIDEASDLAVRAASGLSAPALGALRSPGANGNPRSPAHVLGMNPMGEQNNGRGLNMSSTRTHRLRVLAVQKLAAAYQADEIAASVMVMQGATALDDIAERVLKVDPNDLDARYVHFFHEKIPSRQLAEFTTTSVLDDLIETQPTRLHYFRTRGIVRCFRDEFTLAIKDFTHVYKESRALRKAKAAHHAEEARRPKTKGKKRNGDHKLNGQAPPSGTSVPDPTAGDDGSLPKGPQQPHPSVSPDAPDAIEPQALFMRGATYFQQAIFMIEQKILAVEGVERIPAQDALELKLHLLENGRYGGVNGEAPDGPLGPKNGTKMQAYRAALAVPEFVETVLSLLRKSIRDHEKFMTYFDTVDGVLPYFDGNLAEKTEAAFLLSESLRPGSHAPPPPLPENPGIFTTYHPLLVEAQFSTILCRLISGDFVSTLPAHQHAAALVDGLEGYPIFLPARSMAQAEFVEILERLASSWSLGTLPHSLVRHTPLAITSSTSTSDTQESAGSTRAGSPTTDEDTNVSTSLVRSDTTDTVPTEASTLCLVVTNGLHSRDTKRSDSLQPQSSITESFFDSPLGTGSPPSKAFNLDCLRMLLAPVANRQRSRMEKEAEDVSKEKTKKKGLSINIPLHGPRVDIALAYISAVHLFDFDA